MLPFNPQRLQRSNSSKNRPRRRREPALRRASRLPLRAGVVARRHHSHMIRPVQVAEAIIVLVILFSLFKVVTVEV
jgi:hypothetical protein